MTISCIISTTSALLYIEFVLVFTNSQKNSSCNYFLGVLNPEESFNWTLWLRGSDLWLHMSWSFCNYDIIFISNPLYPCPHLPPFSPDKKSAVWYWHLAFLAVFTVSSCMFIISISLPPAHFSELFTDSSKISYQHLTVTSVFMNLITTLVATFIYSSGVGKIYDRIFCHNITDATEWSIQEILPHR